MLVRLIPIHRISEQPGGQFTFEVLVKYTQDYLNLSPDEPISFVYKDEEGDDITMDNAEEFLDVWNYIRGKVFRVTGKKAIKDEPERNDKSNLGQDISFNATFAEMQRLFEAILTLLNHWISTLQKQTAVLQETVDGSTQTHTPANGSPAIEPFFIQSQADEVARRIVQGVHAVRKCNSPQSNAKTSTVLDLDENFIHARHTCDGCGISPIIGLRYHALNKSDFDYCQNCYVNRGATKNDVEFEPQQLPRDNQFQHRRQHGDLRRQHKQAWEGFQRALQKENNVEARKPEQFQTCEKDTAIHSLYNVRNDNNQTKVSEELKDIEKMFDVTLNSFTTYVSNIITDISIEAAEEEKEDKYCSVSDNYGSCDTDVVNDDCKKIEIACVQSIEDFDKELLLPSSLHENKGEDDIESKESWDVVSDDEVLARASSVIGSRMLESDKLLSFDDDSVETSPSSDLSKNDFVISPVSDESSNILCDSLITMGDENSENKESKSLLSEAVLVRWKDELTKLAELGFEDEVECIEVLERLMAANIGCDRDEPVAVEQVVHHLLRKR